MIIFRQGPPRVQSFQAEMEQKEGWFDADGWRIDDPSDQQTENWWFPDPAVRPGEQPRPLNIVVGQGRAWSLEEWTKARDLWNHHKDEYALELTDDRISRYRARASASFGLDELPPEQALAERQKYDMALQYLDQNRRVTNFPYFLASATAESKRETVQARKTLWQAEQARKLGNKQLATRLFLDGLNQWKVVLAGDRNFHRPEGSDGANARVRNRVPANAGPGRSAHPRPGQRGGCAGPRRRPLPHLPVSRNASPVAARGQRACSGPGTGFSPRLHADSLPARTHARAERGQ
jgi:hypothetical protein